MRVIETDIRKSGTEVLKPVTDRVTREPAEHPDPTPRDTAQHPVTPGRVVGRKNPRREPVGVE